MKIEILNRYTNAVMYSVEAESKKDAVVKLVADGKSLIGVDLRGAYLSGAYLRGAYLSGADLRDAYLRGAYLRGAYLSDAYLRGADLSGVDLSGVDLSGAYLSDANLSGADLSGAYLSGADLRNANLIGANLIGANLIGAKDDFIRKISAVPNEVVALYKALRDGRVDGSCYEGECCCFVGTIAQARHVNYKDMPELVPNQDSPIEKLFMAIRKGDTAESNPISAIVVSWIEKWATERGVKLPRREVVWTE